MKRYRAFASTGQNQNAALLGYQTDQQFRYAQWDQSASVEFREDENGAWVRWEEAQLKLQELETKLLESYQENRDLRAENSSLVMKYEL